MGTKNKNKDISEEAVARYIKNNLKYIFLEIIKNLCNIEEGKSESGSDYPEKMAEIYKKVKSAYIRLDDIFKTDDRDDFKNMLDDAYYEAVNYFIKLRKYRDFISIKSDQIVYNDEAKDSPEDCEDDINNIESIIAAYFSAYDDESVLKSKRRAVMSVLPVRMTKQRYNDYVREGIGILQEIYPEYSKGIIGMYKDLFFADCAEDFEAEFPVFSGMLEASDDSASTAKDTKDAEKAVIRFYDAARSFSIAYYSAYISAECFMRMRALAMFVEDSEFIFGEDNALKELYYSLKNEMEPEHDEQMHKEIIKEIYDKQDAETRLLFNTDGRRLNREAGGFFTELTKNSDDIPENYQKSADTYITMTKIFSCEPDDLILDMYNVRADSDDSTDSLLGYIEDVTSVMSKEDKKRYKQKFLGKLPCTMSYDEFFNYCRYSLEGIRNKKIADNVYRDILNITNDADGSDNKNH